MRSFIYLLKRRINNAFWVIWYIFRVEPSITPFFFKFLCIASEIVNKIFNLNSCFFFHFNKAFLAFVEISVAGEIKITKLNLSFFLHFNNAFFGKHLQDISHPDSDKEKNGIAKKNTLETRTRYIWYTRKKS